MSFSEMIDRVRRVFIASACFLVAVFIVRKGNSFEAPNMDFIVPLMCVMTALALCLLGLAMFVKAESTPE